MKTVEQHNEERRKMYEQMDEQARQPIGIHCPRDGCDGELYHAEPSMMLATFPPMKSVRCTKCSHYGTVIA